MSFLYQSLGDVEFPVFGEDVQNNQLYSVLDPGRDILLALFKSAINFELAHSTTTVGPQSVWAKGRPGTVLADRMPVEDTYYEVPSREVLQRTDLTFPWLAIYRTSSESVEYTLELEGETCVWGLDYVLGPLSVGDVRRIGATLEGVKRIIRTTMRKRGHASYQSGALQFFPGRGGFSSIRSIDTATGPAEFGEQGEGLIFHALHMNMETVELTAVVADEAPALEGVSVSMGVGGDDGIKKDAIEIRTEVEIQRPDWQTSPEDAP